MLVDVLSHIRNKLHERLIVVDKVLNVFFAFREKHEDAKFISKLFFKSAEIFHLHDAAITKQVIVIDDGKIAF